MRKDTYISAMEKITASHAFKERTVAAMAGKATSLPRRTVHFHPLFAAVVSLALIVGLSVSYLKNPANPFVRDDPATLRTEGVYIPAINLPDEPGVQYDMIGLIVYKGKIYSQSNTYISAKAAAKLQGQKLGVTKNSIDEWSTQDDYALEFASTVGVRNVYSVQGYDTDFRIMTIEGDWAVFYENLNDITIYSGDDIFGNVFSGQSAISLDYLSRYDHSVVYPIRDEALLDEFVTALSSSIPVDYQQLSAALQYSDENFRDIQIGLHNGSQVRLFLIEGGYVMYSHAGLTFKMDNLIFNRLWSQLDRSKDHLILQNQ